MALGIGSLSPLPAHAEAPARQQEALGLSQRALDAYLAGDFARAALLYAQAFRTWPGELLYLYNAARAEQRAGQLEAAERDYAQFVDEAPPDHVELDKARLHLAEVRAARKAAAARPADPPTPAPRPLAHSPGAAPKPLAAPAPAGSARTTGGVVLLVGGAALAIGGGVLLAGAAGDQATLDGKLAQTKGGVIVGVDHATATAEQSAINGRLYTGWAVVAGGAVAGVIGGVLLATAPRAQVAVAPWPTGTGLTLAARF